MYRYPLALLLFLLLSTCVPAQGMESELLDFNAARISHQRTAMLVLGGWAVANIGGGLALRANTEGETKRFHEMNAIWNAVNLGIAGLGYLAVMKEDPAAFGLFESLQKQGGLEKILLFNAGLDVGYIMGGLYLTERAKRPDADGDRLRGYGKSVMLQGGFLMLFDLANYFIAAGRDGDARLMLGAVGEGMGMVLVF